MLQTAFTSVTRDDYGRATFQLERVGRAFLGTGIWGLIAAKQDSMWPWERMAWAAFVRRDPRAAIEAFARCRKARGEEVNVEEAVRAFDRAMKIGEGPFS
jgi:hypothetical protein